MVNKEAYKSIFGNSALKETLFGFTARRSFPHAVIFSGAEGSGKKTFAELSAMAIACENENKPCGECAACRKIKQGICPDIINVGLRNDKKSIGVEAVRQIQESVYSIPNDLSVKIYIISDADKMTSQAQNALLKLFEEPPKGVYFFLLCSTAAELLPTVRSRAPELRTEVFGEEKLDMLLTDNFDAAVQLKKGTPDAFRRLLHLSGGSYGMAKKLISQGNAKVLCSFADTEQVLHLLAGSDRSELLIKMNRLSSSRDELTVLATQLMSAMRDMTAVKRAGKNAPLLFFTGKEAAEELSGKFSLSALVKMYKILISESEKISGTNVNVSTAALALADKLWDSK